MKGFGIWKQSRKLDTARPVQIINGTNRTTTGNNTNFISNLSNANSNPSFANGILNSGNTTTNNSSNVNGILNNGNTTTNILSGRKGRSNWRKMSYAEREGLFLEVATY